MRIAEGASARLRALAVAGYPNEACGVLLGQPGESVAIAEVTAGRNLSTVRARDRYELDPGDIVRAEREGRGRGLEVVGFWHSHPDHPARPSQFDTDHAWTDYVYVICSVPRGKPEAIRAWVLEMMGGSFDEVALIERGAEAPPR